MFDTGMYQGPIRLIYREAQQQIENSVLTAVQKIGVDVDKDELLRALAYDRWQYEKGRADALESIVRCKDCKMWNTEWKHEAGDCYCYKFFQWTDPDFFCADGERRDNGE